MLKDSVESVVHHGVAVCESVVFLHLVPRAASLRAERHMVHDGGRPAAGCRHSPGIKVVDCPGDSDVQVHMRMDVHRPRQDQLPRRVDYFGAVGFRIRPAVLPGYFQNPSVFNQEVSPEGFLLRYDRSAADPRFHVPVPSCRQPFLYGVFSSGSFVRKIPSIA